MARVWNFQHSTSAPYHQQANGKAEAAVKIAKRLIRKAEETGQDLWYVLLHWRNIPNHIGSSPVCRLFSRSTRCGVPAVEEKYFPRVVPFVPETILENKRKAKYYYDRKSRSLPSLQVGKPVLVQLDPDNSKTWSPAVVAQKMTDRSYVVEANGSSYRRDAVHIKPRNEPSSSLQVINSPASTFTSDEGGLQNCSARKDLTYPTATNSMATSMNDSVKTAQEQPLNQNAASLQTVDEPPQNHGNTAPREVAPMASPARIPPSAAVMRPKRTTKLPTRFKDYIVEK